MLSTIYSHRTRSIRVFNLTYHTIWLIILIAHITSLMQVDLPDTFGLGLNSLVWLLLFTIGLSIISLISEGRKRTLSKYVSLLLGSLIQLIVAYKYVAVYPPLTPMVIVSTALALWFMGAGLFIKKENKEQINGEVTTD